MNWAVISFVIIFPLVFAIGASFNRREKAIDSINSIRSTLYNLVFNQTNFRWNTKIDFKDID